MNKNKKIIISIIIVVLLILLVFGATYAFLATRTNEGGINTGTGKLDINYTMPNNITGELSPSAIKENGLKAVATASLNAGSVDALFNMYINPTALTNLNIPALKWEVVGMQGGTTVYTNKGDFSTAVVNTPIKIVDGYQLSTTSTTFNVYIWLDETLINTAINNASFGAKISSDSVPITGEI